MEQHGAADKESEPDGKRADEQRSREREALRLRVRESLLRCPSAEDSARA
jgi:hypothetical protein